MGISFLMKHQNTILTYLGAVMIIISGLIIILRQKQLGRIK